MSFFSADGPFNTFMTLVFDLVVLNFLWIICNNAEEGEEQ